MNKLYDYCDEDGRAILIITDKYIHIITNEHNITFLKESLITYEGINSKC